MNHNFIMICATVIVVTLLVMYGLFPLLWDATEAIDQMLHCMNDLTLCK